MGVPPAVSVVEYLRTGFPGLDPEYRDGALCRRTAPDYVDGRTQALLCAFFIGLRPAHSVHPCSETRMRVKPDRIPIPDVAVFYPDPPAREPESPPSIAIEILSLDDRLSEVRDKLQEYCAWGVPRVWLVDPCSSRFYTCDAGLREVSVLEVPEPGISLRPADAFE